MAQRKRDSKKRLKGLGLPVDLCVKIEQLVGVMPGQKPDYIQKIKISDFIIRALEKATSGVVLTPENVAAVKEEVLGNKNAARANQ